MSTLTIKHHINKTNFYLAELKGLEGCAEEKVQIAVNCGFWEKIKLWIHNNIFKVFSEDELKEYKPEKYKKIVDLKLSFFDPKAQCTSYVCWFECAEELNPTDYDIETDDEKPKKNTVSQNLSNLDRLKDALEHFDGGDYKKEDKKIENIIKKLETEVELKNALDLLKKYSYQADSHSADVFGMLLKNGISREEAQQLYDEHKKTHNKDFDILENPNLSEEEYENFVKEYCGNNSSSNPDESTEKDEIYVKFENISDWESLENFEEETAKINEAKAKSFLQCEQNYLKENCNDFQYRAALLLSLAKKLNEETQPICNMYGGEAADILFIKELICSVLSDEKIIECAKKYKGNTQDEKIKDCLEWFSLSEEEKNEQCDKYKHSEIGEASYFKATKKCDDNTPEQILWLLKAALAGNKNAQEEYQAYENADKSSKKGDAYEKFISKHSNDLSENDGTLRTPWICKALACLKGEPLEPLPPAENFLRQKTTEELEELLREIENKESRYYKVCSAIAGEKYLMAYYAKEKCDVNKENYDLFRESADIVFFSADAKWPESIDNLAKPDLKKAKKLLYPIWKDYIDMSEADCFDKNKSIKAVEKEIERYKSKVEYYVFYYALMCYMKNECLNPAAKRILEILFPFAPAKYLLHYSSKEWDKLKNLAEEFANQDNETDQSIAAIAAFDYADYLYKSGSRQKELELELYYKSLFGSEYYSFKAAKVIKDFDEDIQEKIKENKGKIKNLPVYKKLPEKIQRKIDAIN